MLPNRRRPIVYPPGLLSNHLYEVTYPTYVYPCFYYNTNPVESITLQSPLSHAASSPTSPSSSFSLPNNIIRNRTKRGKHRLSHPFKTIRDTTRFLLSSSFLFLAAEPYPV